MDDNNLQTIVTDLNLPPIRYFAEIDSTNEEAWRWIASGAPHYGVIIADKQTAGRGRYHRHWYTIAGGLAISFILLSPVADVQSIQLLSGLGAMAVCDALRKLNSLDTQIKWPNDVLVNQKKVAGVLVENRWEGESLQAAVIGIGINIAKESVNSENMPQNELDFPATSVETALGYPVNRIDLLHSILRELIGWLPRLATAEFIQHWQDCLAYQDQWVEYLTRRENQPRGQLDLNNYCYTGKIVGVSGDGSLQIRTQKGEIVSAQIGEVRLRPLEISVRAGE